MHRLSKAPVIHFIERLSVDGEVAGVVDAQLPCNGRRCSQMVACYHDHLDTGFLAESDSLFGLFPRRVDHPDKSHKDEIALNGFAIECRGDGRKGFVCKGEDSQCLASQTLHHGFCFFEVYGCATGRYAFKCPLDDGYFFPIDLVDGAHHLTIRIKGDGIQAGIEQIQLPLVEVVFLCGYDQGRFGRVSDECGVIGKEIHCRIAAEGCVAQEGAYRFRVALCYRLKLIAFCNVGPCYCHPVLGEGACLVRADDRSASQGFHSGKGAYDRIAFDHALYADGQDYRHNCREPFRDG